MTLLPEVVWLKGILFAENGVELSQNNARRRQSGTAPNNEPIKRTTAATRPFLGKEKEIFKFSSCNFTILCYITK